MVIFGFVHVIHELLHRLPTLVHNLRVAKLLPDCPGNDNTSIGPPYSHHIAVAGTILRKRSYTWVATQGTLCVTHIVQPLVKEAVGIGKECSRLGKHLRIGCPSQTFVTLGAVGSHTQIVGALTPYGVRDKLIYQFVARCNGTNLHILADRCHRHALDALEGNIVCCCNRYQTVAEESILGTEANRLILAAESIFQLHTCIGDAQIQTVHTTLRAVHTTTLGSIAVVQQLGGQTHQLGTFFSTEDKAGHSRAVLTEVNHQRFALVQCYRLPLLVFPLNLNGTISLLAGTFHTFPYIGAHGLKSKVLAHIDLCSVRWENLSPELFVLFGSLQQFGCFEPLLNTGIVHLAVKDCRMFHRSGDTSLPCLCICTQQLLGAIGICQFQHPSEGTLRAVHPFGAARGHNLIGPPSGCYLYGQLVSCTSLSNQHLGDIVGKGTLGLQGMCKAGLQHLGTHQFTVYIKIIDTQTCGHPLGVYHLLLVLDIRHKPVGTVGSPCSIIYRSSNNRSIRYGKPHRAIPHSIIQRICKISNFFVCHYKSGQGKGSQKSNCFNGFHFHIFFLELIILLQKYNLIHQTAFKTWHKNLNN